MRPDFSQIAYDAAQLPAPATEATTSPTPEGIPLRQFYTAHDVQHLSHLGFGAGHCALSAGAVR